MDILIRSLVVFGFIWLVMRVGGRREVAQLSAFDMILLVTLGDLIAQGVVQEDYSLTTMAIAVSTFTLASIALSTLGYRAPGLRPLLVGRPRIVVRDGEPDLDVLHGERMSLDDVREAAREQGIRSLREIELAVLETDGSFSFFTPDREEDRKHREEKRPEV